ncbi:probable cytochrome P450 6a13 [Schistocerca nitens]|uniref:probable cytochrome P450 6a13 n=1 Tax=Schistocerca nitens TaxID=7011 RepID=UPI002117739B|nr:probable cytochrome P450 6a13 [Schistocerca nitens]
MTQTLLPPPEPNPLAAGCASGCKGQLRALSLSSWSSLLCHAGGPTEDRDTPVLASMRQPDVTVAEDGRKHGNLETLRRLNNRRQLRLGRCHHMPSYSLCRCETLRLFSTVPCMPYPVTEDIPLAGGRYVAPRGSTLMVAYYLLHRQPQLFPDPHKFDPGRFLEGGCAKSRKPYSYVPFGNMLPIYMFVSDYLFKK